ncbi:MAG: T9SS type A sorting domain-containing protein [Flavobacteriales bacterium]|nr:T9SS type A sorting domain-containing protein [Flavobacteriales bacterium]
MKKIYTLLAAVCVGSVAFGQTVFQSNLSSWSGTMPSDFTGSTTSIAVSNVVDVPAIMYGDSAAQLINTGTAHKRFSTMDVTVTPSETYEIQMWVKADTGDIRTNYYDVTNGAYGTYNPYIQLMPVSGGNLVMISQQVTMPATCSSAQFILSLRNTDGINDIILDSVHIAVSTPVAPSIKSIYEIQYTTAPSGDSPEVGNVVTTKGVVTGIMQFGAAKHTFFIQDSALAWNGLYVYHTNDSTLLRGDSVEVTGTVTEFNGVTELTSVSNITVLNSGNALPTPVNNTTLNGNMEEWEGVLIKVANAQCTSNTPGFGMWELNDGSGVLLADDDIFPYATTAVVGTNYDVTGIGHYSFSAYKILPRDINDIVVSTVGITERTQENVTVYPNPANDVINFNLAVNNATINIVDITGKTLKSVNTITNMTRVDVSDLANGVYFYTIATQGETMLTDRFIIAK